MERSSFIQKLSKQLKFIIAINKKLLYTSNIHKGYDKERYLKQKSQRTGRWCKSSDEVYDEEHLGAVYRNERSRLDRFQLRYG